MIVFALAQLLPGDVGRQILGPLADPRAVAVLDHKLGVDKPWYVQYWNWVTGLLHGDLGKSLTFSAPVRPTIVNALEHSLKLGAEAFAIVIPLSIFGGVVAALRYGKPTDRVITIVGLSATSIPEFVSSFVLISIFTVWLGWLPLSADPGPGASVLTQMKYLLLPSLPLVLVLFGYIARWPGRGRSRPSTPTTPARPTSRASAAAWSCAATSCATASCPRSPSSPPRSATSSAAWWSWRRSSTIRASAS